MKHQADAIPIAYRGLPDSSTPRVELAGAVEIVERLPHGYDQLLGRWFENGTELSAGE